MNDCSQNVLWSNNTAKSMGSASPSSVLWSRIRTRTISYTSSPCWVDFPASDTLLILPCLDWIWVAKFISFSSSIGRYMNRSKNIFSALFSGTRNIRNRRSETAAAHIRLSSPFFLDDETPHQYRRPRFPVALPSLPVNNKSTSSS